MNAIDFADRAELEACYSRCSCATCSYRRDLIAKVLRLIDELDGGWLVKDFNILYRVALDVSESIVEPANETPPQRNLRAQLERLRPAFEQTEEIKRYLRERELAP